MTAKAATGNATAFSKTEGFAYDTAIMMVGILFLKGAVAMLKSIPSLCESATEGTAGVQMYLVRLR